MDEARADGNKLTAEDREYAREFAEIIMKPRNGVHTPRPGLVLMAYEKALSEAEEREKNYRMMLGLDEEGRLF